MVRGIVGSRCWVCTSKGINFLHCFNWQHSAPFALPKVFGTCQGRCRWSGILINSSVIIPNLSHVSVVCICGIWSRKKVGPVDWIFIMWKCYLGDQAEALIEGLLEHGRLTLEQLIQRAAARGGKGNHVYWFCLNVPLILNNFFEFLDMVVEYLLATLRSSKWVMPLLTIFLFCVFE